jgi:hypothetical protein
MRHACVLEPGIPNFLESGVVPCGEIARLLERKPCTNSATPAVIV